MSTRPTLRSREIAAGMEKQRKKVRKKQRKKARERDLQVEGIEKGKMYGRDERGRKVDLKVNLKGWKTILGFKVELISQMGENFREGDLIPRKVIHTDTDIFKAVRSVKHVRGSHRSELQRNERLFKSIDELQSIVYTKGHTLNEDDLRRISKAICEYIEEVSKKRSGYKLLAKWKLQDVPSLLDQAMNEGNAFRRRNRLSVLCTKLTAFKERYGKWRERQIFNIDRYNQVREDGLRNIRDSRLRESLIELASRLGSDPLGVAYTLAQDWEVIKDMRKAQRRITDNKPEEALGIIEKNGKAVKAEWLKRELREIFGFIAASSKNNHNKWRKKARKMLENFARFLGQRNTRYIIQELKKTRDRYTEPIVQDLENGNSCIRQSLRERRSIGRKKSLIRAAASHYRQAAIKLALI
jgi:hypothetical protein